MHRLKCAHQHGPGGTRCSARGGSLRARLGGLGPRLGGDLTGPACRYAADTADSSSQAGYPTKCGTQRRSGNERRHLGAGAYVPQLLLESLIGRTDLVRVISEFLEMTVNHCFELGVERCAYLLFRPVRCNELRAEPITYYLHVPAQGVLRPVEPFPLPVQFLVQLRPLITRLLYSLSEVVVFLVQAAAQIFEKRDRATYQPVGAARLPFRQQRCLTTLEHFVDEPA